MPTVVLFMLGDMFRVSATRKVFHVEKYTKFGYNALWYCVECYVF